MGLKPEEIERRPEFPEFRTKGGRIWGAKWLYFGKSVQFYNGEMERFLDNRDKTTLLLFEEGSPDPVRQIHAHGVNEGDSSYDGIKFCHIQPRWQEKGVPATGMILIPITRRHAESRHYRVDHVPMESLLVWKDGEYRVVGPSTVEGKTKFFLELRPVAAF